jgi:DNA-binding CsgD family transcriptional regulator
VGVAMFECLLPQLVSSPQGIKERAEGVAFLNVAKSTYPISAICYVGLNIPLRPHEGRFVQCTLADHWAKHCVSTQRLDIERIGGLRAAFRDKLDWTDLPDGADAEALRKLGGAIVDGWQVLSFPLRTLGGEAALLCIGAVMAQDDWARQMPALQRDFQILGNYFHQHIMRIYGHDASNEMLITAREIDCLKWMAAGKTAWEASVILGISERTVRFHLNAAREKLDCLTTTQAVAKAVSQQLISP